jgi:hypothetical protein
MSASDPDSAPPIIVTVAVASDAPAYIVNTGEVFFDLDENPDNNTDFDACRGGATPAPALSSAGRVAGLLILIGIAFLSLRGLPGRSRSRS